MTLKHSDPPKTEVEVVQGLTETVEGMVTLNHPNPCIGQFRITADQLRGLRRKYEQSPDGSKSFEEFLTRVRSGGVGTEAYILVHWCGMWLGIETDGYTHS
jgi:hypothetical protein